MDEQKLLEIEAQLSQEPGERDQTIRDLIAEIRRLKASEEAIFSEEPAEKKIEELTLRLYMNEDGDWLIEEGGEDCVSYYSYAVARATFDEIQTLEDVVAEFCWAEESAQAFYAQYRSGASAPEV